MADIPPTEADALLERQILKTKLVRNEETGEQDYFALQARCIDKFGPAAGVFIRQIVFWTGKGMDPEGWIYKTAKEMHQETGLSRRQQDKARDILTKKGVLEDEVRGVPPHYHYRARHFRVNLERLYNLLHGNTEQQLLTSNTEQQLLHGNSEQEPLTTISERELLPTNNGQELLTGNTEQTTENTPVENYKATPQETSEALTGESTLQVAQNGHFAPQQQKINQSIKKEIRRVLTSENPRLGSPKALGHYREGKITLEDVPFWVSLDLFGSEEHARQLEPTVRQVVEELEAEVVA